MADAPLLTLNNLCVSAATDLDASSPLLKDLSLRISAGETHLLLGRGGAGKTVLAHAILGSPRFGVDGSILFRGDNISGWPTDVRAKAGVFLGSPGSAALPGITVLELVQAGLGGEHALGVSGLHDKLAAALDVFDLPTSLLRQEVVSVTEPELTMAVEILQLLSGAPELTIFDLPEGSVTAASVEILAAGLEQTRVERPGIGTLIMSRDDRLLDDLEPDNIHVLRSGRVTASNGSELAANGTTKGYESLI